MAISIDRLSLWEIAHRWHDADPSHSKTIADIPLDVKDTLRNLAADVYHEHLYSTLPLEREAKIHKPISKRNWPFFWRKTWFFVPASHYEEEFKAVMNNNINPTFLQSIMIPHWELEYWCKEYHVPFPEFWVCSIIMGGKKAPFPGAIEFFIQEDCGETDPEPENGSPSDKKPKSENHRRAAQQRHEPVNQLKRECVLFFLTQKGSNTKIAERFYDSLPADQKKLLSAENAIRTLSQAIAEYKQGVDKDWLKGIPRQ
ncbi:MAG: hypothetical protein NTX38_07670 [Methylobacter sp.]|nr:hypothetical protein [Methylobacter sp.]